MKAPRVLKSMSIQILFIGMVLCTIMYKITDAGTLTELFAGGFLALVTGRKVRDAIQSNKGQYFDEDENKLKSVSETDN